MRAASLRLRMAMRFAALAVLALGAVGLGGAVAMHGGVPASALIGAGAVTAFGVLVSAALVALLFDENFARPVDALAAALRARAHGRVAVPLDPRAARHLADLAPAAAALCERLAELERGAEERLAEATARIEVEKAQLTAILSEIPIAVLAVDGDHCITLYDKQCVHVLGGVAALGVGRSVFHYLDEDALREALDGLDRAADTQLPTADGAATIRTRLCRIAHRQGYVLFMEVEEDVLTQRPLVFDFSLTDGTGRGASRDTTLSALPLVVFDTETTGLDPSKDEIVQIGAVRILNGNLVDGEAFETLVDPGREIPRKASQIHGITAKMLAGAPTPRQAIADFRRFSRAETLVAHNAPFDMRFLARHTASGDDAFDAPVLDTVLLSAALFGEAAEHSLDAIAERLGVPIDESARHTAIGDAIATAEILLRMLPMLSARGVVTLGDAVAAMRRHQRLVPEARSLLR